MNVGFLLDASSGMSGNGKFTEEVDFMKRLAASFGISPSGTRSSVVKFGSNSELAIKFKDHDDIQSFWDRADGIVSDAVQQDTHRIDSGLRTVQRDMFSLRAGIDPTSPKILILITDGRQSNVAGAEDPVTVANELTKAGVNIISIGIGANVDTDQLKSISAGDDAYVFNAASIDDLKDPSFMKRVTQLSCQVGKSFCTTFC